MNCILSLFGFALISEIEEYYKTTPHRNTFFIKT